MRRFVRGGAAGLVLLGALALRPAAAARPDIMPVDDVRPGMKGHAVTVFSGTGTDRFEIEVIDVIRDYLPRQDAILFRSSDPRMVHSGIVGGMSGSPIYIDGKLVGALAYGYRFNKDPIGGITPISNMFAVGELPFRPEVLPQNKVRGTARPGAAGWADAMLGLGTIPLPQRRRPDDLTPQGGLAPLGAPMSVSGLGAEATRFLADALGLVPARGGSGGATVGDAKAAPAKTWQGGDSVSVVLIRGDNAVAPNGTVTWVGGKQGEKLLAFGHEMLGAGPSNLPIADARVHVIIPSVERSVKLSSALHVRGSMVQDRQAAISLRTDVSAPMIPVTTELRAPEPDMPPRVYHSEVALGVDLTPALAASLLVDALGEGASDGTEVVAEVSHEIDITTSKGPRTLKVRHEEFFPAGVDARALGRGRGALIMAALLNNEFEVAKLRAVRQTATLRYDSPVETLESIRLADADVHAGDLVTLELRLRDYRGSSHSETLSLRVPDDAADQDIQIEVTGGDNARPPRPMPSSLDDLIDTLQDTYPARSLVATIYREAEGLSTRHGLLPELPASVLESLAATGTTTAAVRFKQMARRVIPRPSLIEGEHTLKVSVKPRRSFASPASE
ncbi:SpoIVB peptidase S55 domain-containing protein [Nannocystis sp. SCPEA4]|uniref:SpoIVB peptidase S55 domain-containing protein n=1 Tax=Nannocystis sp. SCPEA4 TaxID=2996787 RepID=UPI00227088AD|nr:SpoIVB peptidase S55 domain-containing protein [Nannocystis sp. SCPEA4]MCY1055960.1 hypothetical protein [Nannocystis sp. SCPEA4]